MKMVLIIEWPGGTETDAAEKQSGKGSPGQVVTVDRPGMVSLPVFSFDDRPELPGMP